MPSCRHRLAARPLGLGTRLRRRGGEGIVAGCFRAAGTTAILNSAPFERRFRDAMRASRHLQGMLPHAEMVGRPIIGVENKIQHL